MLAAEFRKSTIQLKVDKILDPKNISFQQEQERKETLTTHFGALTEDMKVVYCWIKWNMRETVEKQRWKREKM